MFREGLIELIQSASSVTRIYFMYNAVGAQKKNFFDVVKYFPFISCSLNLQCELYKVPFCFRLMAAQRVFYWFWV